MFFKRPKTSNNFWIYFDPIGWDDYNEKSSKESEFDTLWDSTLEDPIYFWYLIQIIEAYESKSDESFLLSDIWEVENYSQRVWQKSTRAEEKRAWYIWATQGLFKGWWRVSHIFFLYIGIGSQRIFTLQEFANS